MTEDLLYFFIDLVYISQIRVLPFNEKNPFPVEDLCFKETPVSLRNLPLSQGVTLRPAG
jgi:hypothetical protein